MTTPKELYLKVNIKSFGEWDYSANVHKLHDNPYHRWAYRQTTQSGVHGILTSDECCCSDPPANTAETAVRYDNTQMSRQVTIQSRLF